MTRKTNYNADMTAGSLLLNEMKIVSELLLDGKSFDEIKLLVETSNVLQKRSISAAKRIYALIRNRLQLFDYDLWKIIRYGDFEASKMAAFSASIKHSQILGDFMLYVLREKYQLFERSINKSIWLRFVDNCRMQHPDMPIWTDNTTKKMGDCVFRILAETGYINTTKDAVLQKVYVPREVKTYLQNRSETYVLKCIEVSL